MSKILLLTYIGLHVKNLLFLSDFNDTLTFSTDFWKTPKYQISRKSVWVVPCRWTDIPPNMTKLVVTFCNFSNSQKCIWNITVMVIYCYEKCQSYIQQKPIAVGFCKEHLHTFRTLTKTWWLEVTTLAE